MSSTLGKLLIFVAGAAIGSAVTYKCLKTKYDRIVKEELDSIKETFGKKAYKEVKRDANQYEKIIEAGGYASYSEDIKKEVDNVDKPYVISPDEFGDLDYETISLNFYEDGVLADDMDNVIEDVEDIVGYDSFKHFGEYEADTVFVRNDRLKCDYEILADERKFSDVCPGYEED